MASIGKFNFCVNDIDILKCIDTSFKQQVRPAGIALETRTL
jgi:hypothetical protein